MTLTGMPLAEVLWTLPAAVAYQLQLVWMQMQGEQFVIGRDLEPLLARLKKARAQSGR
jgi:hypothetical protein